MTRSLALAQSLTLSLMLLGIGVQITAGAVTAVDGILSSPPVEQHHDGDGHTDHAATPAFTLAEAQTASIGGDVLGALAAFLTRLAAAARGAYICDDCNLPSDDGCRCVCYSGGYDPTDPACQD